MQVLELFSGIGGMHFALKASGVIGEVKASIDINPVANSIYQHNFPFTNLLNRNIQHLTRKLIEQLQVNTILMSPPCQPFTRNGLMGDIDDDRSDAFKHILNLLPELDFIDRILIENVKGFEVSQMRNELIQVLKKCNFNYQEFILSPTQCNVPNSRHRYYCIAKKKNLPFTFESGTLKTEFVHQTPSNPLPISNFIDQPNSNLDNYLLPDNILIKYANLLDICYSDSNNSCCFTKAYSRFVEGTGSVFTSVSKETVRDVYSITQNLENKTTDNYLNLMKSLKLRYFTPSEVSRLMSFPESFNFPVNTTKKQRYMVLGNSINVKVVAELIKLFT